MTVNMRGMVAVALATVLTPSGAEAKQELWKLDNLSRIGGRPVTVEGQPCLIRGKGASAIEFDGTRDSLFVKGRPLVGTPRFTIEVEIRPDGGEFEQKFLHVAETDPKTGVDVRPEGENHDANNRIMFELRAVKDGFYLDGFLNSASGHEALATPDRVHPVGKWYVVAQTFDGTHYRTYVDGKLQGDIATAFSPQGAGNVRIGARMNGTNHFKGAIARIRFTDRALAPKELMRVKRNRPPAGQSCGM